MIGKIRVKDLLENEMSATYIGYSDEKMNLNKKKIKDGKLLTVEEIRELAKRDKVTPHLLLSLDLYLKT